ncbi:phage terminase large subunit family protein [Parasegetibacter sp. NRK P23]|uniref:phage terminase large subunit family protein n=1 Tax=Parasegetibacter sp. NRK P23 TaxID=2942999 RepID=UPI00204417DE|nr:phage terminase large subunit family protein [Parasegetibacter sp. NRK P23]MCM5528957.1 phage terminase large subunit family protein [Parasegetibacter sp. NRK P23]
MFEAVTDIDLSLISGFLDAIRPDPSMTVSEWADAKGILPQTSAEAGKYKVERTPYLREIMDKLSVTDPAQRIIVKKGSQLGFTEAGNNWVGYCIDLAPAPFIFIMPTDTMMKDTSKLRIEPMIKGIPDLRVKVSESKSKDGGNTILNKQFAGGFLKMIGANSPVGLSSYAARNIYGDEIDRYPISVGNEGSVVDLAKTRTATFGSRRKIYLTSSPKLKGTSQIDNEFQKTGQRYYNVPCPSCGYFQVLEFEQLRYTPGKYTDAKYECSKCKTLIEEYHKTAMLSRGKWVPKFPDKEDGFTFGYHISAMYSPYGMYSWSEMALDYEESRNDVPKQITFVNTKLGECYEPEHGEKIDHEALYERAEDYPENSPWASVAFITAGVDVQKDRLEGEIVGWIKGKTSQSIEYFQIIGDTSQDEVWRELSQIVNRTWVRQGDNVVMPLRLMAVDTGYNTQRVYQFVQQHSLSKVVPIKGDERLKMMFSAPKAVDVLKGGQVAGKVKVYRLGVSLIKSEIYGFLKLRISNDPDNPEGGVVPEGYCHFPKREYTYFRGLTAEEEQVVENNRGFSQYQWVKKYKRNEPLDCRVYARGAAAIVGMDRWTPERWLEEASQYEPEKVQPIPQKPEPEPQAGGFWDDQDERLRNF